MDNLLTNIGGIIFQSTWLAPLLALIAGVLTSFTPCSLSSIPLVIGYVGGTSEQSTKKAFRLSLVFSLGMAVTFTVLGTAASLLGRLMQGAGSWWYILLGVLMVLMALQTWELFSFIPSTFLTGKTRKKGNIGALLAGMLGGLFSSPCATPVLVVLLAIVAQDGNILWGILLLLLYAIGHSALVMIAGTSIGWVQKTTANPRYGRISHILKITMGALILMIAFYMFYLGF